jgi:tRNA modification GTPase
MPSGDVARDTIAALATPAGRGGIGVIRLSGLEVPAIAAKLIGRLPAPRHAAFCTFLDAGGQSIDRGIAIYFPAPRSYTGEPVLELQGHGGPVVMQALLGACIDAGARIAEPGEFTRRAFLEGKLDLAQAEAVADLIDAASREAARSALRSLSGEFSTAVNALEKQLVELRTLVEAMLDFPDEEVDPVHRDDAAKRLGQVSRALQEVQAKSRQGSLLRAGIQVVIAGRPNVGKSSLLNRLAGQERAIVTPIAGTTRDALREAIQIEGVPLVVVDTAGLRTAKDEVEKLGMERTRHELARADVVLEIFDAADPQPPLDALPADAVRIRVYNKVDLVPGFRPAAPEGGSVLASAKTGAGLDALRRAILDAVGWTATGESVFLARERHLRALELAARHLSEAGRHIARWDFFAEELRLAQAALGTITGGITADDLLGEIFSRFCIGK